MSTESALAATTATLKSILGRNITNITTRPPDQASKETGSDRINLFLYQVSVNTSWANRDLPNRVKSGERGFPPLALDLHYLITAHSADGQDFRAQLLLGQAMLSLHDHPVLSAEDIRAASVADRSIPASGLDGQIERVRVRQHDLSADELSKLWTTFQTPYRLSTTYQASVVLIHSRRASHAALPVLRRGSDDRGVNLAVALEPVLERIEYRAAEDKPALAAAVVGSSVLLFGQNLPRTGATLVIRDPGQTEGDNVLARLNPESTENEDAIRAILPTTGIPWKAGPLTIELELALRSPVATNGAPTRAQVSNALAIAVAPQIRRRENNSPVIFVTQAGEKRLLMVGLAHELRPTQRVYLLLNLDSDSENTFFQLARLILQPGDDPLTAAFDVTTVPTGRYRLRLRVDGVDSTLVRMVKNDDGELVIPTGESLDFDPQLVAAL